MKNRFLALSNKAQLNAEEFAEAKAMLDQDPDLLAYCKDEQERTALYNACRLNNFPLARILLEAGANPLEEHVYADLTPYFVATKRSPEIAQLIKAEYLVAKDDLIAPAATSTVLTSRDDSALKPAKKIKQKSKPKASEKKSINPERLVEIAAEFGYVFVDQKPTVTGMLQNRKGKEIAPFIQVVCAEEQMDYLRELIDGGAEINSKKGAESSPLFVACAYANEEMVSLLLSSGADAKFISSTSQTVLHSLCSYEASEESRLRIAELLFEHGADPLVADDEGNKAHHYARKVNMAKLWAVLLNQTSINSRDLLNERMDSGKSDDLLSGYQGKKLNQKEVDSIGDFVGRRDENKSFLLFLVSDQSLSVEEVSAAGNKKLEQNLRNFFKENPNHRSLVKGFLGKKNPSPQELQAQEERVILVMAKDLLASGADSSGIVDGAHNSFVRACLRGNVSLARILFDDLKQNHPEFLSQIGGFIDENGTTALHSCVVFDNKLATALTSELLQIPEINVDLKPRGEVTALSNAIYWNNTDAVRMLLERGAQLNLVADSVKEKANEEIKQMIAEAQEAQTKIVSELGESQKYLRDLAESLGGELPSGIVTPDSEFEAKSNKFFQGEKGITLLHVACCFGRDDVASDLLFRGANINKASGNGDTPLSYACISGDFDLVEKLIEAGANPRQANNQGQTPLHVLVASSVDLQEEQKQDRLKIAKKLIAAGADMTLADDSGRTPTIIAKQGKFPELFNLLSKMTDILGFNNSELIAEVVNDETNRRRLDSYEGRKLSAEKINEIFGFLGVPKSEARDQNNLILGVCSHKIATNESQATNDKKMIKHFVTRNPDSAAIVPELVGRENLSIAEVNLQQQLIQGVIIKDLLKSGLVQQEQYILRNQSVTNCLSRACQNGNFFAARVLLDDINKTKTAEDKTVIVSEARNHEGRNLSHYCAAHNNNLSHEIIAETARFARDSNVKDSFGFTPLATAIQFNNIPAAKLFLQHGATLPDVKEEVRKSMTEEMKTMVREHIASKVPAASPAVQSGDKLAGEKSKTQQVGSK